MKEILVKKADGSTEPFKVLKLEHSLESAGASKSITDKIVKEITSKLVDGMTTEEIYNKAFLLLKDKEKKPVAAKYSLKKAVFDLGPSGFPFEDFIAEIYKAKGYKTSTGIILKGSCAKHEVDLLATNSEGRKYGAEIKFHNRQGIKTDLKVALYVNSRFNDLTKSGEVDEGILITNTKFTKNVISYGECVGLKMISWNYPQKDNLYSLIEETGLHPITCLTTITNQDKRKFFDNEIVLCRDIKENTSLLKTQGISTNRIPKIIEEASTLCQPGAGV